MYIFTIYIFIILLSGNNVFLWLKHRSSHQFWIYSHISDFVQGFLQTCQAQVLNVRLCNRLFLVLFCSWSLFSATVGLWPSIRDSRHSCSGRSFCLPLALGSLSRERAKAMYSAAFGLFLSEELLKGISFYSPVLWPWHIVWAKTAFLMSCCLMCQKFLLVYSARPISGIDAEEL